MGLQKHAQEDVEQKIKELWDAFESGYVAGMPPSDEEQHTFEHFLKAYHPLLAEYLTPELYKRIGGE